MLTSVHGTREQGIVGHPCRLPRLLLLLPLELLGEGQVSQGEQCKDHRRHICGLGCGEAAAGSCQQLPARTGQSWA